MKRIIEIYQDDREPELQLLADVIGMDVEFKRCRMKVGDYSFGDLLIERKEINDFCLSILDKRIESQIEKMKESDKECFIIIVGKLGDRTVEMHENCVLGKIISLVVKHKMKIIQVEDEWQFLYVLKNLCEKYENNK